MSDGTFKTTIRFSEEFNERLRVTMARRRVRSMQQAVDAALEQWMSPDTAPGPRPVAVPPASAVTGVTKDEQALAQQFLDFVRSGDETAVQMVKHALELHARKQKASRKRSSA